MVVGVEDVRRGIAGAEADRDRCPARPPIDSYIVVRRNVPPNVNVCLPFSQVSVFETL